MTFDDIREFMKNAANTPRVEGYYQSTTTDHIGIEKSGCVPDQFSAPRVGIDSKCLACREIEYQEHGFFRPAAYLCKKCQKALLAMRALIAEDGEEKKD